MNLKKIQAALLISMVLLSGCEPSRPGPVTVTPAAPIPHAPTATFTQMPTPTPALTALLNEIRQRVEARQPDQDDFGPARDGMILAVSGQVRTDEQGAARLDLSGGTSVRVGPQTIFTLVQLESQPEGLLARLQLVLGELWILLKGGALEVETPGGIAAVRGSYMGVQVSAADAATRVTCLEGSCSVRTAVEEVILLAGQAASLPGAGPGAIRLDEMRPDEVRRWLQVNPEATVILPALTATVGAWRALTPTVPPPVQRVVLPALSCLADRTCAAYCARFPVPRECLTFRSGLEAQEVDMEAFWSCFNGGGDAQTCADRARRR